MDDKKMSHAINQLAEGMVPDDVDLWPEIRSRYELSEQRKPQGERAMFKQSARSLGLRTIAFGALALLVITTGFLAFPQGRVWARQAFQFFRPGLNDAMPGPTAAAPAWVEVTPDTPLPTLTPAPVEVYTAQFAAECGGFVRPRCTVEQISALAGFEVKGFADLPDGLYFTGATGSPGEAWLFYQTKTQNGGITLIEEPFSGNPSQQAWDVGASAAIETVMVGSAEGQYVKGSYVSIGDQNQPEWRSDADSHTLRWVADGISFTAFKSGYRPEMTAQEMAAVMAGLTAGPVAEPEAPAAESPFIYKVAAGDTCAGIAYTYGISLDALIASNGLAPDCPITVGQALTIPRPAATPEPAPEDPTAMLSARYPLTVEQARAAAGFDLRQPSLLPEDLALLGARVDPDWKYVTLFFLLDQTQWGPNTDGLSLNQMPSVDGADCALCALIRGDGTTLNATPPGKLVGLGAVIEPVTVGGASAEYVEGVWALTGSGAEWQQEPYVKRLRWRANGTAYELEYFGMRYGREDLIKIAESIR